MSCNNEECLCKEDQEECPCGDDCKEDEECICQEEVQSGIPVCCGGECCKSEVNFQDN
tara:strand:+ start:445 stop:618 length:174 start_codon:yes stop_codon:yes gene_type:complete